LLPMKPAPPVMRTVRVSMIRTFFRSRLALWKGLLYWEPLVERMSGVEYLESEPLPDALDAQVG